MTNIEIIKEIVKDKGYITSNMLREEGIETWYLSSMVEKGLLERVGRGVYITPDGVFDEYFVFQYRHSKAIFSYLSALALHGLTDEIPQRLEVSVYQGYNTHRFCDRVAVHYVKKNYFDIGITEVYSPYGNPIKVYDKERTLCDLVYSKRIVDSEVFKKAFQEYIKQSDKDLGKLMKYANRMGIDNEMFTLLEVLS